MKIATILGFLIGTIAAVIDLQVTLILPIKFYVSWPFSSEEVQNRFSWWPPELFELFLFYRSPQYFLQSFESMGLSAQEKKPKTDFQNCSPCSQLAFLIGKSLANFDLQVTPILPIKFWVNWTLGSGKEVYNRFSRWLPRPPYWIADWDHFSYFWPTSHPNTSYQVFNQLTFRFRRSSK